MDLTQLEMFNAVAEAGSITQAAAKVHRVPSNPVSYTHLDVYKRQAK